MSKTFKCIIIFCFVLLSTTISRADSSLLIRQVTGEVAAVDAKAKIITVKGKKGDVTAVVNDATKIIMGKDMKPFSNLKTGHKVKVKYSEADGKLVAISIAIKPREFEQYITPTPAPALYREESNHLGQKHVYLQPFNHPKPHEGFINSLEVTYELFYIYLKSTFVFNNFNIYFKYCGQENAFSNATGDIIICNEFVAKLLNNNLEGALPWIFLHEVGHSLLRLWDYPLWDNEDAADEFATVLLLMAGESGKDILTEAIREWKTHPSFFESLAKVFINDRHSVSAQRARNISLWIKNSDALKRQWLKIFVPNMQTQALKSMLSNPEVWMDKKFIERELQQRES